MKITSKRRRTKQEIIDEKAAALSKEQAIQDKLATIDRIQQELQITQEQAQGNNDAQRILAQMAEAGHVHRGPDGNWNPGPDPSSFDQMWVMSRSDS